ncbi:15762_t:CDS:2, partial [Dentiscutata erythropus]
MFDLEQSLYEYALVSAEFENDLWKEFSVEDIPILQEISNEKTAINKSSYTENTYNSWGIRYVCCQCYEKNGGYLHVHMGTGKADPGCTATYLGDTKTTLLYFAKLIEMVAYSENDITKKNLLQVLIPCMENFNLDSFSASSSKLPSLFNPKKYEELGKSLALEVLKSRTSLAPYKSILESPDSLQQYYEAIPKCLTSLFDSLFHTLLFQKYEIVKQKQKECKSIITEFDKSDNIDFKEKIFRARNLYDDTWDTAHATLHMTQIFRWLIVEYPMEFTMDEINVALKEVVGRGCKTPPPN